jgi:hypothetical protein
VDNFFDDKSSVIYIHAANFKKNKEERQQAKAGDFRQEGGEHF